MTNSQQNEWEAALTEAEAPCKPAPSGEDSAARAGDSVATQLVALARDRFDLFRSHDGEPFAVDRTGPGIVRMLRGARGALRAELSAQFLEISGRVAPAAALTDALVALEGLALREPATTLYRRVAESEDGVLLDLGDESGRAVTINSLGWRVIHRPLARFHRSALTGPLLEPRAGGRIDDFIDLLNIDARDRDLLVGFLVSALLPGLAHPIALMIGEQGAGKTTAARLMASLIDPGPAPIRTAPSDQEAWCSAAANSWVVALDNLSGIPGWLSDALCRASTGDTIIRRRLYTDSEVAVVAFRRVVILTGIDIGGLRGDLGDRLVRFELRPISAVTRRNDAELTRKFLDLRPQLLGALLDILVAVLRELPEVHLQEAPRMADFAHILAAMDRSTGSAALKAYLGQRIETFEDIVAGDPFAAAVRDLAERGPWRGTCADLLAEVSPTIRPSGWPRCPEAAGAALRRFGPAFHAVGVVVSHRRTNRSRVVEIHPSRRTEEAAVTTVTSTSRSAGAEISDPPQVVCEARKAADDQELLTVPSPDALDPLNPSSDSSDGCDSRCDQLASPRLPEIGASELDRGLSKERALPGDAPRDEIQTVDTGRSTGDPSSQFGAVTDPPGATSTPAPEP